MMVAMHVDSHGSGAPLVLIHGWGMHGGIWDNVVPLLAQHFRVHCVDLPGHGYSKEGKGEGGKEKGKTSAPPSPLPLAPSPFTLDIIVEELSSQFGEPSTSAAGRWAGWWRCAGRSLRRSR